MLDFSRLKLTDRGPIYQQIVRFVKLNIVSGMVAPGEEIPSRRFLSSLLGVNPNTIQKACHLMEEEGILTSYAGSGSVVSFTPESAAALKRQLLWEDTLEYLGPLKAMGLSLEETLAVITKAWGEFIEGDPPASPSPADRKEGIDHEK